MAEPQTLEEGWQDVHEFTECLAWHRGSCAGYDTAADDLKNAVRALALAVLTEMDLPCCGVLSDDDPAWCGDPFCLQGADLRRRIEALGR